MGFWGNRWKVGKLMKIGKVEYRYMESWEEKLMDHMEDIFNGLFCKFEYLLIGIQWESAV
jgi:hypothetical protein